jgi:hypothetical protein
MMDERDEELLQGRLDGTLTAAEAADLQRRLDDEPAVKARASDLQAIVRALDELEDGAPAPDVVPDVMARIKPRVVSFESRSAGRHSGGARMSKKVMIGLAAAAAVVLAVAVFSGFPPVDNAQGTIGAAKRYNGGQLSDQDVKLGDASAQEFLQSETFDRLMKDPNAVKLLSDPSFSNALGRDAIIRSALTDQNIAHAFADTSIAGALTSRSMLTALGDPKLVSQLTSLRLVTALGSSDVQSALAKTEIQGALTSTQVQGALARQDVSAAINAGLAALDARGALKGDIGQALKADLIMLLNNQAIASAVADLRIGAAITSPGVAHALVDPRVQTALGNANIVHAIGNTAVGAALADGRLGAAIANPAFGTALQNAGFVAALSSGRLGQALNAGLRVNGAGLR